MKTKKELLEMLDELKYAEVFEELDKWNLDTEAYQRLKKEFVLGKTDIDFHDRLKVLLDFQSTQKAINDNTYSIEYNKKIDLLENTINLLKLELKQPTSNATDKDTNTEEHKPNNSAEKKSGENNMPQNNFNKLIDFLISRKKITFPILIVLLILVPYMTYDTLLSKLNDQNVSLIITSLVTVFLLIPPIILFWWAFDPKNKLKETDKKAVSRFSYVVLTVLVLLYLSLTEIPNFKKKRDEQNKQDSIQNARDSIDRVINNHLK